ncbi:arginyltransferase [Rubricella aquisinus]|nr:arginyltransferase [Rubricella aquisinus]
MRHLQTHMPQFYVTAPQPCPYLEGRVERKLFTSLANRSAQALNDTLSQQGFRRSQNVLYRPSCADCSACLSARIRVADFKPSRNQRRVVKRNEMLERNVMNAWATEEQYDLFRRYLDARHADGGMADMDMFEYAAMVEESPVVSRVIEYNDPTEPGHPLKAVCLTDVLQDGVSMVYSFFEPSLAPRSVGTHLIVDHVALAAEMGLPYVYLGYWVPGSPKMQYKSRFRPLEIFYQGEWTDLSQIARVDTEKHPLTADPIQDQVAAIQLPRVTDI